VDVDYQGTDHRVVLDEWTLASAVSGIYSGSADQEAELGLAQAAAAAHKGDLEPIRALIRTRLIAEADVVSAGPRVASFSINAATSCHDYVRTFDYSDSFADRGRAYERHVKGLNPADFAPFSPTAWVTRNPYDSGACLRWPDDPTARPPFGPNAKLPDVPVLVLTGDLDANTATPAGRAAAAQFPHAKLIEVPNAGHTPVQTPAGAQLAMDFIVKAHRS
jgi:pimeloyl-ACP methyl ester carboxylesterase